VTTTTAPAEAGQYLTFELAGEEYALDILQVREILRFEEITRVPTAPAHVRGVLNLRGRVVPVVDLAVRFGLPPTAGGRRTCIVIVDVAPAGEPLVMGIMADAVSQVIDLLPGDVEPPPSFGTRVRIEYLRGMARSGARFTLLLDLDRLLATEEAAAVAEAAASVAVPPAAATQDVGDAAASIEEDGAAGDAIAGHPSADAPFPVDASREDAPASVAGEWSGDASTGDAGGNADAEPAA
jgi:purine-binding chemotaxis protein CheW